MVLTLTSMLGCANKSCIISIFVFSTAVCNATLSMIYIILLKFYILNSIIIMSLKLYLNILIFNVI